MAKGPWREDEIHDEEKAKTGGDHGALSKYNCAHSHNEQHHAPGDCEFKFEFGGETRVDALTIDQQKEGPSEQYQKQDRAAQPALFSQGARLQVN